MRTARLGALALAAALATTHAASVRADDASILTASGEQLYKDGKKLYGEGKYADACAKFEASQKADPASGTLFFLGLCSEKLGKTATAYGYYLDAMTLARKEGGPDSPEKVAMAQKYADALSPKLAHLTVVVPADAKVAGLKVTRDGLDLDPALWGVAMPSDAGEHVVEATAPGYVAWSTKVTVAKDGDATSVSVEPLQKVPPKAPPPAPTTTTSTVATPTAPPPVVDTRQGHRTQRVLGWTLGAVGLVGLGVGSGFGLWARSRWNTAKPLCPNDVCATPSAQSAAEDARRYANVSTIGFVVGAVGVASGIVLILTSDDGPPREAQRAHVEVAPSVGPGAVGFVVGGSF